MKHLYLLVLCAVSITLQAQTKVLLEKPKVDERVELLSIVFRMAGAEEYSSEEFKLYTNRINKHFASYKNHPISAFVQKQRETAGTGYDAVMKMAVHISPAPNFKPLVTFTDNLPERWGEKQAHEFLALLRQYYKDADCEKFFSQNRELYRESEKLFMPVFNDLDTQWYKDFYGKEPKEKFNIILGLGNGGGNYGPDLIYPDGRREVFAIMGTWATETDSMPRYGKEIFPTLVHEFNHSFVNYLNEMHKAKLEKGGSKIFGFVETQMRNQAYANWQTMLDEALVRAAVIKYMKDHKYSKEALDTETNIQLNRGFIWIEKLVAKLEEYSANRNKYPTLESYMPKLIHFYNNISKDFGSFKAVYEKRKPKVAGIAEFNNAQDVNPNLKLIQVTFDRPLLGKGYSVNLGEKGREFFPDIKKITYSTDRKTVLFEVDLLPGKEYEMVLTGRSFKSEEGIGMDDYLIKFKTAAK
jgi:hypothetical protein